MHASATAESSPGRYRPELGTIVFTTLIMHASVQGTSMSPELRTRAALPFKDC
jgi:hypothetical protein